MDQIETVVEYNGFETTNGTSHADHGWKKVVYPKRNRKQKPSDQTTTANGTSVPNGDNVFRSLEEKAEDRHRRILAAKKAADDDSDLARSKLRSDEDSDNETAVGKENIEEEIEKCRNKKTFSSRETWDLKRKKYQHCQWDREVWFKYATPKNSFILWVAMKGRLATGDRMRSWNGNANVACVLCDEPLETREHLFFECPYSGSGLGEIDEGSIRGEVYYEMGRVDENYER